MVGQNVERPEQDSSHNMDLLTSGIAAESKVWGAKTQAERREALANLRQIFDHNIRPGDTTFEITAVGDRVGAGSGPSEHPFDLNIPNTDRNDLTLRQDGTGNFIATFTHEDAASHEMSTYQVTQDPRGNISFRVQGAEGEVDGQTVSADGTTTHSPNDNAVTVSSAKGSIAFHENPDGSYSSDVAFADGTTKQKPISAEQFAMQQQHSALFVNWLEGNHYVEGIVPQPFE